MRNSLPQWLATRKRQNMLRPELLMPAGSLEKLKYAIAYGADAVYAGVPIFSLRARENDFDWPELKQGVDFAHERGKKVYLTANIFARNSKIKPFTKQIDEILALSPDALIMSDPGLISLVKERAPHIPVHLSVQANCMNYASVRFWQKMGIERIILSRELRLEEVRRIREEVPDIELEAFVHGSICIAYSGRCLMSHYMSYRDANQGVCDNSCRYKFKVYEQTPPNTQYYLEDQRTPNEFYPIDEDENGTYLMSAKDLCLIEHLKEIQNAGVCSFKVEGRTKSLFYLVMVTRLYRQAIDDLMAGKEFDPNLRQELETLSNRGYHSGFMMNQMGADAQKYSSDGRKPPDSSFAGVVRSSEQKGIMTFEPRNQIRSGQILDIISPEGRKELKIEEIWNTHGKQVDIAHGGTGLFSIKTSLNVPEYSILQRRDS